MGKDVGLMCCHVRMDARAGEGTLDGTGVVALR